MTPRFAKILSLLFLSVFLVFLNACSHGSDSSSSPRSIDQVISNGVFNTTELTLTLTADAPDGTEFIVNINDFEFSALLAGKTAVFSLPYAFGSTTFVGFGDPTSYSHPWQTKPLYLLIYVNPLKI